MKLIKNISKVILISLILCLYAERSFSIGPDVFVQSTVNRASEILGSSSSKQEKINGLKEIAKDTVDIKGIGYYTLGKHRKNINAEQLETYSQLFEKYFLKTFASRLAQYTNPEVKVDSSDKLNENYTMVHSHLIATEQRPKIQIDWRVHTKDPKNLMIRDLIIEGLSLARTQKEEFNSIILNNNGNIDFLFISLNEFIKK